MNFYIFCILSTVYLFIFIMSEKVVLGYWAIRGRGQILRHLLSHTGLQFQDKLFKSPEQYSNSIGQLGPFPNLPYLQDGDFVISETLGIARYIARRSGHPQLLGKTPAEEAIMDNFMYAFEDLFVPVIGMFFNKKVMDIKAGHFYKIKSQLQKFDKWLQGREFVIGYLSIADFFLAEYSYYFQRLYPDEFKKFSNLVGVRDRVMELQGVKAYYTRQNAVITPFLPPAKTSIPFFWPGTQPNIPTPPAQKPVQKKLVPPPNPKKQEQAQVNPPKQIQQSQAVVSQVVQQQIVGPVEAYTPQNPFKVVVISGSVSGNNPINHFLGLITGLGHPALAFQWCDISSLQIHNEDLDESGTENANALRGQVYEANGVLIGVTEMHGLVSMALANAFNWLVPVLKEKPVALVSVQSSQAQFRKALEFEQVPCLKSAKLSVADYGSFLNGNGELGDESLNKVINFINKFAMFIETGN